MRRGGILGAAAAASIVSIFDPTTFLAAEAGTDRMWFLPGTEHTDLYTQTTGSPPATPSSDGLVAGTFFDDIMDVYWRSSSSVQPTYEATTLKYLNHGGVSTNLHTSESTHIVRPGWYGALAFRAIDQVAAASLIFEIQQGTSNRIRLQYVPTTGVIQFVYRLLNSTGAPPVPASITLSSSAAAMPFGTDHILEFYLGINVSQVRLDGALLINTTNDWQADDAMAGGVLRLGAIGGGGARIYRGFMCRKSDMSDLTSGERTALLAYLAEGYTP